MLLAKGILVLKILVIKNRLKESEVTFSGWIAFSIIKNTGQTSRKNACVNS